MPNPVPVGIIEPVDTPNFRDNVMFRMKCVIVVVVSLFGSRAVLRAETSAPPAGLRPVYSLEQFGPVATRDDAEKAFQKASEDILEAGGGVLMIPANTFVGWRPHNNSQGTWRTPPPPAPARRWGTGLGVTVVDARGGTVKVQPPQATGLEFNRVLDLPEGQSLPFWGTYPIVSMRNTILNGSCSYRDQLKENVEAGKDRRFYVKTIRGIFPGMFMSGSYGNVQRLYVKSLGYDKEKQSWYFVADTDAEVSKNDLLGNKNHVNILKMDTYSHNENQTFDVMLWRHNYSQGDNYLIDARFKYMGDVHSTGGDENGVIYGAFVQSLTGIFRSQVETWSPETGELKYGASNNLGKTLGTGRPIINLNKAKWITGGTVMIARPGSWTDYSPNQDDPTFQGKTYPTTLKPGKGLDMGGLIRFSAEAPVTEEAVGRYFAVDQEDEHVMGATGTRRWYLVDSVRGNPDGTKDLRIIRHWWGAKSAGAPTLYKAENYSSDGHEKPLKYVIAPGANVYDVSEGVNHPARIVKIVPTPFTGTEQDFAPGDPIEQAIGPDPFRPTPFRSWLFESVPGAFPATVFDIANRGVMRDSVMSIRGGSGSIERDRERHYDRNPPWKTFVKFEAACNTGLTFAGDTADAAILFAQPNNRSQPIKWRYGAGESTRPKAASLTVSADSGDFNFEGGDLRTNGSIIASGLSANGAPARNLRGKNVAIKTGTRTVAISFPVEEADADYAVFIEQTWLSNRAVVKKEARGFTVQFKKRAPKGAKLDWMIVR